MEIRSKIIKLIYEITRPERPDLTDHSKRLLASALDSLDFASFLMSLEDEFNLTIDEDSAERLGSIDQIVAYIESEQQH